MVNSINSACDQGYVPDHFYSLDNPEVEVVVDRAAEIAEAVVQAHRGEWPNMQIKALEDEVAFDGGS